MIDYRPSILIVDIDEDVISLFRDVLKQSKYKFFSSIDYTSAIDFLDMKKLDLLIVDLYLGEVDHCGLKLAARAREIYKNIQIIIITDNPDVASIHQAVEIDVYDYLQKPIPKAAISRSSSRAIEKKLLLDERDDLKSYVDQINAKLKDSEERYLQFTKEFKAGRFELEEKLEARITELKKAVAHIKPSGVKDDKDGN